MLFDDTGMDCEGKNLRNRQKNFASTEATCAYVNVLLIAHGSEDGARNGNKEHGWHVPACPYGQSCVAVRKWRF